jgi:competence protein ComEC
VDGDDAGLSEATQEDFRTTGLTHLLAVSGTNLTLLVSFLLLVGRRVGVSAYGQVFVVVWLRPASSCSPARSRVCCGQPPMGLVAVVGLGSGGRRRGVRALAWSVLLLVLIDPWLSRSVGFALSVSATAGILLLAPAWRDALARWLPPLLAEALAIPLAAQVVCTPVVAAISGQVSLVAVAANLAVAPAVGPRPSWGCLPARLLCCGPQSRMRSAGWPGRVPGGSCRWRMSALPCPAPPWNGARRQVRSSS